MSHIFLKGTNDFEKSFLKIARAYININELHTNQQTGSIQIHSGHLKWWSSLDTTDTVTTFLLP